MACGDHTHEEKKLLNVTFPIILKCSIYCQRYSHGSGICDRRHPANILLLQITWSHSCHKNILHLLCICVCCNNLA